LRVEIPPCYGRITERTPQRVDVDRRALRARRGALLRVFLVFAFGIGLLPALLGCTTVRYLAQASAGQVDLRLRARDNTEVLKDIRTELWVKRLLSEVASIKRFGERQGLTPTANYTQYADLQRPYAVWVVSACEPLRFHDKTWSFPIVGSVPYLGWFYKADAEAFAEGLRKEGWDVSVRGADAYSTLGWFNDPVLSTMIGESREAFGELVNVILHESLHASIYFEGQTDINESLANFVADRLTVVYLDERLGPASPERAAYVAAAAGNDLRVQRLLHARQALWRDRSTTRRSPSSRFTTPAFRSSRRCSRPAAGASRGSLARCGRSGPMSYRGGGRRILGR
jgi:predicted aminopeptidase